MPLKENIKKIALIGGDVRQKYAAEALIGRGYTVSRFAIGDSDERSLEDALDKADLVILPIPLSRDGKFLNAPLYREKIALEHLYDALKHVKRVALGAAREGELPQMCNCRVTDYGKDLDFTLKNARATAEGALSVIISETPKTVRGSVFAIMGYGKIARELASMLKALGGKVKIFARSAFAREEAKEFGMCAYDICDLGQNIFDADVIINTVPAVIFTKQSLSCVSKKAKIVELASAPGGVRKEDTDALGITLINAQSLPARFSPESAAQYVIDSVFAHFCGEVSL